ncbi:hypothetical protein Mmc1_2411 [Magnetococcus marinus MC-1]|uniref:Integral membrane protein-like protein n=1 Tax=Magnetococcus marinus (strain ATCC BAA-1437 / JCM 17883 / MC-1) TaxID=156889 RepID=A0LAB8_MAGMM|nr:lysylphosphatidylglycerol synthase transmembrane domain-containing protein [Magnetococcus marinus]ABK44911.1 hypothetical protein Mmc1_2411 [Magnetococcus marinus MC-1]
MQKLFFMMVKIAVASGAILWLVREDKLDLAAMPVLMHTPFILLLAVLLTLLAFMVASLRWWLLLRIKQINMGFGAVVQIVFITNFFTTFMPGGILSADLIRLGYTFKSAPEKRTEGAISVFTDRFVALFSIFCMGTVVGLFQQESLLREPVLRGLWGVSASSITIAPIVLVVLYRLARRVPFFQRIVQGELQGPLYEIIKRMVLAVRIYRQNIGTLITVLLLSMVMHVLIIGTFILFARVMVPLAPLQPLDYMFAAPWAWIASLLPVSPGGLGVGEAAFDQVCRMLDGGGAVFGYASLYLAFRILSALCSLPGAVIYLIYRSRVQAVMQEKMPA